MNYLKRTWCDINLNNLKYNIQQIKSIAKKELFAVVKANAYGHGDEFISKTLQDCGIKYFAVSNYNEARNLRSFGITGEILILGHTPYEYVNDMIEYNISQTVYDLEYAKDLSKNITDNEKLKIHIKVDTGMCRIGFLQDETHSALNYVKRIIEIKNFDVQGIFTHFSSADSFDKLDEQFTINQMKRFDTLIEDLTKENINIPIIHTQNSAGIINYSTDKYTHARAGVLMYGLKPSEGVKENIKVKPILSIKTTVAMVKEIDKDYEICYGRTFKSKEKMKVATLTIGYADGYCRAFSNCADVIINGVRCKVLGRVCMDQTVCDVTGIDVKIGDEVVILGKDGLEEITADELAKLDNTINYELVCGISCRVPRVYHLDNEIIGFVDDSIKYK